MLNASIYSKIAVLVVLLSVSLTTVAQNHNPTIQDAIQAFEAEDYHQAKQLFRAQTEQVEVAYYLARIDFQMGELNKADAAMEALLKKQANDARFHYWFAMIKGRQAGEASIFKAPGLASDSKKHFEKAVQLEPDNPDYIEGLMAYYTQAPSIVGGSTEKALQLALQLTEIDQKKGLIGQLNIYLKDEDKASATQVIKQLIADYSDSAQAMFIVGLVLQGEKEYPSALDCFQKARLANESERFKLLTVSEQKAADVFAKGAIYQIGRNALLSDMEIEKGIEALETFLTIESKPGLPSHNWARTRLAALYFKQGNTEKAKKLADMAAADKSKGGPQKEAKKLLKQIKRA